MVRDLVRKLGYWGTRVVYPPTCGGCGLIETWMCSDCAKELKRIDFARCCSRCGLPGVMRANCPRCSAGWPSRFAIRSVYHFEGPARRTLHRLKYLGEYARAEWAGEQMVLALDELDWQPDFIAEVPLWPARERQRGFNQSEKLAQVIADRAGTPHEAALLRVRDTRTQVGLNPAMRWTNVRDAFSVEADLRGKTVMIIDDVTTTGATLASCAAACKLAGASRVVGLTFATAVDDGLVLQIDRRSAASAAAQATQAEQESARSPQEQ